MPEVAVLAATDPANPYGSILKFPAFAADGSIPAASARQAPVASAGLSPATSGRSRAEAPESSPGAKAGRGPTRSVGATVILVDGALVGYLSRGDRQLLTWLSDTEPQRSRAARALAQVLIDRARSGGDSPRGMLIEEIDGMQAQTHQMAPFLGEAGFIAGAMGMQATFPRLPAPSYRQPASSHTPAGEPDA
jgi:ATP-dependent Lhr-like helicase